MDEAVGKLIVSPKCQFVSQPISEFGREGEALRPPEPRDAESANQELPETRCPVLNLIRCRLVVTLNELNVRIELCILIPANQL